HVHPAVLFETRMDGDRHEPAAASRIDIGKPGDRLWIEHTVAHDAELPPRSLRHEDVAVRQEREIPRELEALHHGDAHLRLLSRLDDERLVGQRPRGHADLSEKRRRSEKDRGDGRERDTYLHCKSFGWRDGLRKPYPGFWYRSSGRPIRSAGRRMG